jgi:hypothetical protein
MESDEFLGVIGKVICNKIKGHGRDKKTSRRVALIIMCLVVLFSENVRDIIGIAKDGSQSSANNQRRQKEHRKKPEKTKPIRTFVNFIFVCYNSRLIF